MLQHLTFAPKNQYIYFFWAVYISGNESLCFPVNLISLCNLFWFSVILFSLLLQYIMVDFNVSTICQNLYSLMKRYYYSCTYVWMSSHCFLRFFIVMKQLNRLYHFTYMILRWKKKWRATIINVLTYVWMDKLPSTLTVFWDFYTVMKQKRLYHFMDLKYIWYIKIKKKWIWKSVFFNIIINVHMFEWTIYLQHLLFFEILFQLWWNKRDCITLRIVDIIFRWKKNEFFSHSEFSADLCILWFYLPVGI